jgi:Domain of unknown function (DUF4337)
MVDCGGTETALRRCAVTEPTAKAKPLEDLRVLKQVLLSDKEWRDRWIGVYIGVLAVMLAICTMGGGNATKDATRLNIEAANVWGFFQAKNLRRTTVRLMADNLELQVAAQASAPEAVRQAYAAKLQGYRDLDKELTSNPKTNEGLDELWVRAKALEKDRDEAMRRDPYFDWSQAALQIAIVLASVCLITPNVSLLIMSGMLSAAGLLLLLNGFTLAVRVPFIG